MSINIQYLTYKVLKEDSASIKETQTHTLNNVINIQYLTHKVLKDDSASIS